METPQEGQETMNEILNRLREEKAQNCKNGLYRKTQIEFAYNSNRIEGSKLTREQTRYIFETNTLPFDDENPTLQVDDLLETVNHFACFDYLLDSAERALSEEIIKNFHRKLKSNTADSRKSWFAVGDYKKLPNEVADMPTALPKDVPQKMADLVENYRNKGNVTLLTLLDFHKDFEDIHPFQDGNGRVGRLILFRECLYFDMIPFIITDDIKYYYYRGLKMYRKERGCLRDTCLTARDRYESYLKYFDIPHADKK